jgi:hypothetical protein
MTIGDSTPEGELQERGGSGPGCPRSACLQLFLDGELEPTPASDVEAHLAACAPCAERASLLVAMKGSLRRTCAMRASDALRARICLSVARDGIARDVREEPARESATAVDGVEADFHDVGPSRESLIADRFGADRATLKAQRGARVAYGVGALALAAGVALAVVGERVSATTAGLSGTPQAGDTSESARSGQDRSGEGRSGEAGLGLPGGLRTPDGLLPVPGRDGVTHGRSPLGGPALGAPALAPSAIAGRHDDRPTFDTVLDDLVAEHMNPLPPEETNPAKLRRFESLVGVAMRPPTLRNYHAHFRGARVLPMRGAQRTAMLQYELPDGERVTVYLWNPQAVPIGTTRLRPRILHDVARDEAARDAARDDRSARLPVDLAQGERRADAAPIYVGEARGYSVAACERRGVGYALATKRDADESVRMVAASVP